MTKLTSLTKDQIDRFPEFIKKWTDIGLSTEPVNRSEAEEGVKLSYKIAGLPPPKIVWCSSPLAQGLTRAIVLNVINKNEAGDSVGDSVRDSVRNSVWNSVEDSVWNSVGDSVGNSVWDSVRESVRNSVWDSVEDSVWNSVRDSVRNSVWNSVWNSVRNSVRDSVRNSVGDSVRNSVWNSVWNSVRNSVRDSVWNSVWDSVGNSGYGQHDASWLGFYDYFKEACKLDKETQILCGIWKIAQNAGWWLPHQNICWISERHNFLSRDDKGLLHNYNGAALTYPDGWSIYSFHGVRVPEKYVLTEAEKIDINEVLKETSSEVRMAVFGKIGLEKALGKIPHKIIDSKNGNDLIEFIIEGELVRGLLVKWKDKFTNKSTVLPVPTTIKEFKESFCDDEYPEDFPDNPNDCEQVRISTFRGFIHQAKQEAKENGKHWMDCIEWVVET